MPVPRVELFVDDLHLSGRDPDDPSASVGTDAAANVMGAISDKLAMLFSALHPDETIFSNSIRAQELELEVSFGLEASSGGFIKLIIDPKANFSCKAKVKWVRKEEPA